MQLPRVQKNTLTPGPRVILKILGVENYYDMPIPNLCSAVVLSYFLMAYIRH